jgi:RimJ/RimL family protein N-acetyltransferase
MRRYCARNCPPVRIRYKDEKKKLYLRPLDVTDIFILQDAFNKSKNELLRFMPWAHYAQPFENEIHRLARTRLDYFAGIDLQWGVFDESTNDFVMSIAVRALGNYRNPNCLEIGYWTSTPYTGQGIATLMTQVVTAVSFLVFDCDRVQITCNKENHASKRVIEKCGFHVEGECRNFFSRPTDEMIENGYESCRIELLFSLISDDIATLPWFDTLVSRVTLDTIFGKEIKLSEFTL